MSSFQMFPYASSRLLDIYLERSSIDLSPSYQRISGVWDDRKQRLLIDSIVNAIDLPKIYFHELYPPQKSANGEVWKFAVIDGKQRLEAIFQFIEGNLRLPDEFKLFDDDGATAASMNYHELGLKQAALRERFDNTTLPIILVRTDDLDLIEEMFTRLNESVPLTAAEYRNALGGPLPRVFRALAAHQLFDEHVAFETQRHRYLDLSAKFFHISEEERFVPTKKTDLDTMVRRWKRGRESGQPWASQDAVEGLTRTVESIMDRMTTVFGRHDALLGGPGWTTLWYHTFRVNPTLNGIDMPHIRTFFQVFAEAVAAVRARMVRIARGMPAGESDQVESMLARFDSLRQSLNDGGALRERYTIMGSWLREQTGFELVPA